MKSRMQLNVNYIKAIYIVGLLMVIFSPVLLMLVRKEYDTDQYFVYQPFLKGRSETVDLCNDELKQEFTSTDDNLAGFDLMLSGSSSVVEYCLCEGNGVIREGEFNSNESIEKTVVRFESIDDSSGKNYILELKSISSDRGDCPQIRYSIREGVVYGNVNHNGDISEGQIDMSPVYKSDSVWEYIGIVWNRLCTNISFYK